MAENDANAGGDEIQVGKRSKLPMILAVLGFLIVGLASGTPSPWSWRPPILRPLRACKDDVEEEDGTGRYRDDQPR